ncbi:kinase-like domain-containing protein [Cladochytrium replicatum]|nr:kinase-like domain-containing protein [Cladochytrium replicatum]
MGFLSKKDVPQPNGAALTAPLHPLELDGMRKLSEYQIVRHLGKGACAEVKEVFHTPTGASYALKIIAKTRIPGFNSEASRGKVLREMTLLGPGIYYSSTSHGSTVSDTASVITSLSGRQVACNGPTLSHPSIVTIFDTFQTQTHFYIVLELAQGGTLFSTFVTVAGGQATRRHFKESDAARLLFRVVSGVAFLHDHDIVHRDLKPDNIMFRRGSPTDPKLARKWLDEDIMIMDFGVAQHCQGDATISSSSIIGTPRYAAPEILCLSGHGKPADMWSLGCLAYASLCGYNPFYAATDLEHLKKLTTAPFVLPTFPAGTEPSQLALDFIRRCLQPDPFQRMTARQALKHPWLAAYISASDLQAELVEEEDVFMHDDAVESMSLDATPTLMDSRSDSAASNSGTSRADSPRLSISNDSQGEELRSALEHDVDVETGTTPRGFRPHALPFELCDRQAMSKAANPSEAQNPKKESGVLAFWKVAVGATPSQQVSALTRTVSSS